MAQGHSQSARDEDPQFFGRPFLLVFLALAFSIAIAIVAFHQTLQALVATWTQSESYGHGLFILPLALVMAWRRRRGLSAPIGPSISALVLVASGCALWLVGEAGGALVVKQFGFVLVFQGIVATLLGWPAARTLAFPLLYLFLMVPFGEGLVPHLRDLAAWLVAAGLRLIGVPVYIEGTHLMTPVGSFVIADACAGLRFTLPIFALALFYADLMYQAWPRRLLFLAIAMVVTIIANAARALLIILVAEWRGFDSAMVADHLTYGWGFLSAIMIGLFLFGLLLRPKGGTDTPAHVEGADVSFQNGRGASLSVAAVSIVGMMALTQVYGGSMMRPPESHADPQVTFPSTLGEWAISEPADNWAPTFPSADTVGLSRFEKEGKQVDLFIAHYRWQRQGSEMIHPHNRLGTGGHWRHIATMPTAIESDGRKFEAVAKIFQGSDGRKRAAVVWYWVGKRLASGQWLAKALESLSVLARGDRRATAFVVSSEDGDTATALDTLRAFARELGPPSTFVTEIDE